MGWVDQQSQYPSGIRVFLLVQGRTQDDPILSICSSFDKEGSTWTVKMINRRVKIDAARAHNINLRVH